MKFYLTHNYYGGDVNLIELAAIACNAQLLAVQGYALEDFPRRKRPYVKGPADYLFFLERASFEEARDTVDVQIRAEVRVLYLAQTEALEQAARQKKGRDR